VNRNTCSPWDSSPEDMERKQELLFKDMDDEEGTAGLF